MIYRSNKRPSYILLGLGGYKDKQTILKRFVAYTDMFPESRSPILIPFESMYDRAKRMFEFILEDYPIWSSGYPINIVSHSSGCVAVMYFLEIMKRHPDHSKLKINKLVFISPMFGGHDDTQRINIRNHQFHGLLSIGIKVLTIFDKYAPAFLRNLTTQSFFGDAFRFPFVKDSVFEDLDPKRTKPIVENGFVYIKQHNIPVLALLTESSTKLGPLFLPKWDNNVIAILYAIFFNGFLSSAETSLFSSPHDNLLSVLSQRYGLQDASHKIIKLNMDHGSSIGIPCTRTRDKDIVRSITQTFLSDTSSDYDNDFTNF